ncbi:hypothetical protein OHA79_19665 [Streptomyces sp. NBC_00841]|uniref:hypothetical protein n=1 Tax=unclassified Streptomyces TaxID=2593676 RepID=UPI0022592D5D|nr:MULTISPECIES: hypothetical protein [unclassified Streptomyces]MCX4534800.1 hypothetical protein [Streptomyces sp. NBC_01669]WRZ99869.1 hypothetical protein OHA79_19665 [Streptomyces sp. NBC_00841]
MPFGSVFDFAQNAVGELVTELSSFTKFRDRIDELLKDLKGSPADARKLGEDRMSRAQFGGEKGQWAEADALHHTYKTVITELEQLSGLLSDSIEGMGIAVLASHKGYEHVDLDVRERMLAIRSSMQEHYGGEYDPGMAAAKQNGDHPTAEKPAPDESAGTA